MPPHRIIHHAKTQNRRAKAVDFVIVGVSARQGPTDYFNAVLDSKQTDELQALNGTVPGVRAAT